MKLNKTLVMAGIALAMTLGAGNLAAQNDPPAEGRGRGGGGRGGFDPAQMQQRMMEGIRDQFAIKDDTEWKVVEPLVQKVMDARRDIGFGGAGMGRMFRRPGGDNNSGDQGNRRRGFGPEPGPEDQALEKAIDSKAPKDELKAAMAKVRAAKKTKEAKLIAAQEELKKVLTTHQEAVALSIGLVN